MLKARNALKSYMKKFSSKMNGGNRINISLLYKLITYLAKYMKKQTDAKMNKPGTEISALDIFEGTTGDLLNIHSLEKYLTKSKIAFKLESYMEKLETDEQAMNANNKSSFKNKKPSSTPVLFKIKSFLYCLSNPSKSGKLFFDKSSDGDTVMTYLLLDPSEAFKDIVEESKCVILAGGTMEPISDFTNLLFPYLSSEKINHFNCGHIIPDSNLNVYPIRSFNGCEFEFTFDKRNGSNLINNLGQALIKVLTSVPFGVVVFFPSYKYLDQVVDCWKKSGLLAQIGKLKKVFTESKTDSAESVLQNYSSLIETEREGAVLFSVVGGKMSEGINFSDDLARAVIMVGLPFPNVFSGDLIAKRKYIETTTFENGGTKQQAMERAKDFYENICMKAVNQSVGRAIRNINDYAVIYLIDSRYQRTNIQDKLSGWIKKRLLKQYNDVFATIGPTIKFFASKKSH
ncbi:unnamed protein product [Ambrosiozyma monospora]|uniref:ATP-dependent DNA helicase CHL1 n=1 Tax=Ambrosiozyma monospora TaxID=43982 RepID=A0A9W6Z3E7_AMBMO|nr:unnamed protein product [Ambrosiozyma monospora]